VSTCQVPLQCRYVSAKLHCVSPESHTRRTQINGVQVQDAEESMWTYARASYSHIEELHEFYCSPDIKAGWEALVT
jgi:hypothetical protein